MYIFSNSRLKFFLLLFLCLPRSDAATRRALEELTEKLNEAQKQDVVRSPCS